MGLSRAEQMSRIRGANTQPELVLRDALIAAGLEPEQHVRVAGLRPDLVLQGARVAVFIDGCFWHGCPQHYVRPRSRSDFWAAKLRENVERDHAQVVALERAQWRVVRTWEHSVFEELDEVVGAIVAAAEGRPPPLEGRRVIRVEALADPWQERRFLVDLSDTDTVVEERIGRRVTAKWRRPRGTSRSTGRARLRRQAPPGLNEL